MSSRARGGASEPLRRRSARKLDFDVAVIGGSLGGVAAAQAACEAGARVILTESDDWLGGQLTGQAVPPDEHPWIERFGRTRRYHLLRTAIRAYYRGWYPVDPAVDTEAFNPGAARVSPLAHEPRVALAVIRGMLAPHISSGRLTVLTRTRPVRACVEDDLIRSVEIETADSTITSIAARYFLDGTDEGDLLPLVGAEHTVGSEEQSRYGEPHAGALERPENQQAITYCLALSHHAGEDHTIDRPLDYAFWRDYSPEAWTGRLLSFTAPDPRTLEPRTRWLDPNPEDELAPPWADTSADNGDLELWRFRRILARRMFRAGTFDSDITLVNWPMTDYWLRPIIGVSDAERAVALAEAKQLSLSVLYWLQTEAPRPDGGTGYPGLRLRPDVVGSDDGLSRAPYIREGRRIHARRTVTEHDVSTVLRGGVNIRSYPDAVGIGAYRIDLHPTTGGDPYIDISSTPFEIPLGALLPVRIRNLIAAGKSLGTTHIANGCYRLHPVEWNVGEAAGVLAARCSREGIPTEAVYEGETARDDYLAELDKAGVERHWPMLRAL
ncbi:MAG: FAD-dependent oxidoreductase [Microbacterium sp.]|uniref:FAD-dependent oxidoreductase n=1 Tax=Microbacterium sp. TaxID=51671 RepID=UPI0039E655F7